MEFLKEFFTENTTYESFKAAVSAKGLKLADLSKGEYVAKGKLDAELEKTKSLKTDLEKISGEMQTLKNNNASAEDYKTKFEELQKTQLEREKADQAKQLDGEFANRFAAITADKKWINEHTKNGVMSDWRKAVESGEHAGKGDADIFTQITKDIGGLYQGVQASIPSGGISEGSNAVVPKTSALATKPWNKFTDR